MKRSEVWRYWLGYSALVMMVLHVFDARGWAVLADVLVGGYATAGAILVWLMATKRRPAQ